MLIEKLNSHFANTVFGVVPSVVYNEDCVTALKRFDDNHFDLAIVDPPYGIGDTFIGFSTGAKKGKLERVHKEMKWDDNTPTEEYFAELKRVSKKQIIWGLITLTHLMTRAVRWFGIKIEAEIL